MTVETLPSAEDVAPAAARIFVAAAADAIAQRGRFIVALAGGSTPAALYRLLAAPQGADWVDWPRSNVCFGDERCVPPDDPRSNYGQARASLLDHVALPLQNIHRMMGEWPPEDAAAAYEKELGRLFPGDAFPRFDLILLGMGEDGHTASLFPDMPALDERERWAVATDVPAYVTPNVPRVTVTFPVLNAARAVVFLVTGKGKAGRARAALSASREGAASPVARIQPVDGQLTWLLDEEAASLLDGR